MSTITGNSAAEDRERQAAKKIYCYTVRSNRPLCIRHTDGCNKLAASLEVSPDVQGVLVTREGRAITMSSKTDDPHVITLTLNEIRDRADD